MRVVIAEDQFLLRDGLTRMLEAHGLQVVAAVDNGTDLFAAVTAEKPDVAIVDVRLPPTFTDEGLRAALAARRKVPGLPVLVLSQYVEQLYARELLADGTGGIGYLLKDRVLDSRQFADSVRRVAAGSTAMDPEVIARLLAHNSSDGALAALSQAHRGYLPQAGPAALRRRQPASAGRACLPRPLTLRSHAIHSRHLSYRGRRVGLRRSCGLAPVTGGNQPAGHVSGLSQRILCCALCSVIMCCAPSIACPDACA
jgi:DNA-binding NarL/FixJ family response regulator